MVLAWKKPHWLAASTCAVSTSVCALLAPVSETARKAARMAIRMAIFLFSPLIWPASDIFSAPPTFDLDQVDTGSSAVPLQGKAVPRVRSCVGAVTPHIERRMPG